MKKTCLILLALAIAAAAEAQNQWSPEQDMKTNAFYQSEAMRKMMKAYGDAIDAMTTASIDFGADTETEWAADTVHKIWMACQDEPFDFVQSFATIQEMQAIFAYGITYAPATFYRSKYYQPFMKDKDGGYAAWLDEALQDADTLRSIVRLTGSPAFLKLLSSSSLLAIDLYFYLHSDLSNEVSTLNSATTDHILTIDSLRTLYPETDLSPFEWYLDGLAAFHTYWQFIRRTCPTEKRYKEVQPRAIAYAKLMDANTPPIRLAYANLQPLPPVDPEDFRRFIRKEIEMRTEFAKMLTRNFQLLETP